ncbi:unnamed protein product [Symbiodinium sp. CCMP2456]|nr:unnamed protein product [Symbiodinium sp. CCMP2456]
MASDPWDWEEKLRELEVRLRDELRAETAKVLSQCVAKVERLESELRVSNETRLQISEPASWSPDSANGELEDAPEQKALTVQPQAPKPQTLQESNPKGEMKGTEPGPTDEAQEPIPFTDSTWNLLLVLGFTKAGWIDIVIGCGVFVGSLLLQGGLCYVLLTGDFLGKPLTNEIDIARTWRAGTAHDFKHLDIAETSLVSRVCNGDGSLIMSTQQAAFISQLNTYLGMQADELAPEGICPGSVLCVLCISWWCLYLGREYRQIFSSLEGLWNVPRGPSTILEIGNIRTVSFPRFFLFCAARISKAVISSLLLAAGIQWLVNTIAIRSIVLRAVALKSLFELDGVFYAAFMPKQLQVCMKKLKPMQFRNSSCRSQIESLLLLLFFVVVICGSWYQLVDSIGGTMEHIKTEYCGGNQNFVVAVNDDHGLAVGRSSMPYDPARAEDAISSAVHNYAFKSNESTLILFHTSPRSFEKTRVETMATATTSTLECANFDRWFLRGEDQPIPDTYGPYFWSAALSVGMPPNSTCEDMIHHCADVDAQLLRMVCGETCGCVEAQANPLYKVRAQGCLKKCESPR